MRALGSRQEPRLDAALWIPRYEPPKPMRRGTHRVSDRRVIAAGFGRPVHDRHLGADHHRDDPTKGA